uniref:Uncharacterized protein n=1 Tax=Neospora caninum (strain Liverpool) TaxID=572307 RepID=A0A0F7UPP3_NEOCL|nr:TPA: hypothetical protein BN1204_066930 [Neospora caninum Liverpool]
MTFTLFSPSVRRPLRYAVARRPRPHAQASPDDHFFPFYRLSSSPLSFSSASRFYATTPKSARAAQPGRAGGTTGERRPHPPSSKQRPRRRDEEQASEFRFIERFKRADFDHAAWRQEAERKAQSDGWHVVATRVQTPAAFEFDRQVLLPEFSSTTKKRPCAASGAQAGGHPGETEGGCVVEDIPEARGRQLPRQRRESLEDLEPREGGRVSGQKKQGNDGETDTGAPSRGGRDASRHDEGDLGDRERDGTSPSPSREDAVHALIAESALNLKDMPPPPVTYFDHLTEFAGETDKARSSSSFSSTVSFPYLPGPPPPSRFFTKGKEDWRYQWRREDDEDLWRSPDSSLRQAATGNRGNAASSFESFADSGRGIEGPRGLERKQLSVFVPSLQMWKPIAVLNSHQLLFALQQPQVSLHPRGLQDTPAARSHSLDAASSAFEMGRGYPVPYWRQLLSRLQRIAFSFDGPSLLAVVAALTRHLLEVKRESESTQALLRGRVLFRAERRAKAAESRRQSARSRSWFPSAPLASVEPASSEDAPSCTETVASERGLQWVGRTESCLPRGDEEKSEAELQKLGARAEELNSILLALTQQAVWKQLSDDTLPHLPFLSLPALASLAETFALLSPKLSSSLNVVIMQAIEQVHGLGQPHLHSPSLDSASSFPVSHGAHSQTSAGAQTPGSPPPATVRALFRLLDACAEAIHVSCALATLRSSNPTPDFSPGHLPNFLSAAFAHERFETRSKAGSFEAAGVVGALSHQLFETVAGQADLSSQLLRLPLEDRVRLVVHGSLYWQEDAVKPATRQFLRGAISSLFSEQGFPRPSSVSSSAASPAAPSPSSSVVQLFALLGSALVPSLRSPFPPLGRLDGVLQSEEVFHSSSVLAASLPVSPSPSPRPLLAAIGTRGSDKLLEPLSVLSASSAAAEPSPLLLSFFGVFSGRRQSRGASLFPRGSTDTFFAPSQFACLLEGLAASLLLRPSSQVLSELSAGPCRSSSAAPYTSLSRHSVHLPARPHEPAASGDFSEDAHGADSDYAYLDGPSADASPLSSAFPLASAATERISLPLTAVLSLQRCLGGEVETAFRLLKDLECTYNSEPRSAERGDSGSVAAATSAAALPSPRPEDAVCGGDDPLFVVPRLLSLCAWSISQQLGPVSFPQLVQVLHSHTAALRFAAVFQLDVSDKRFEVQAEGAGPSTRTPLSASPESSASAPPLLATSDAPPDSETDASAALFSRRSRAWRREIGACLAVQLRATGSVLRRLSETLALALSPAHADDLDVGQDETAPRGTLGGRTPGRCSAVTFDEKNVFEEDALHALLQNGLGSILFSITTAAAVRDSLPQVHAETAEMSPAEEDQLSREAEAAAKEFEEEAFRCMRSIRKLLEGETPAGPPRGSTDLSDAVRRLTVEQQVSWLSTLLTLLDLRLRRHGREPRKHDSGVRRQMRDPEARSQPADVLDESARVFLVLARNLQRRARLFSAAEVFQDESEEAALSVVEASSVFAHFVARLFPAHASAPPRSVSPAPEPDSQATEVCLAAGADVSWLAEALQLAVDDVRNGLVHASPSELARVAAASQTLEEAQAQLRTHARRLRCSPLRLGSNRETGEKVEELREQVEEFREAVESVSTPRSRTEGTGVNCNTNGLSEQSEVPWEEVLAGLSGLTVQGLSDYPAGRSPYT